MEKEKIKAKLNIDEIKKIMYGNKKPKKEKFSIKFYIKNLYNKFLLKPFLEQVDFINKIKQLKRNDKLKRKFEAERNITIDRIKNVIDFNFDYGDSKHHYWNQKLVDARKQKFNTNKPCFYDPEINEIHNENLVNPNLKPLSQIIKESNNEAKIMLERQKSSNNIIVMDKNSPSWMPSHEPKSFKEEFGEYKDQASFSMKDFLKEED
jgi:hypothetical protein